MPLWFILTIVSVTILAFAEIAQKVALNRKDDISAEANNFGVWIFQGTLALIYVFLFTKPIFPTLTIDLLVKMFALGSIYFWAGTLYYTSYKGGAASVNSILVSSSIIVSTALGIIFFHESVTLLKFVGSVIILLAIVYLNYDKKLKWNKSNNYALAGAALYGIAFTLDKGFSLEFTPHIYQVLFAFSIGIVGLLYRGKIIVKDLRRIEPNTIKVVFISALTFFIWNKLNFVAYTVGGEVGRIDSINNAVVFIIILLEVFLLKDKSNLHKKIISAAIALAGISILGIVK